LTPELDGNGLPKTASLLALFDKVTALQRSGKVKASYTPGMGGVAEAVLKMALGNSLGFRFSDKLSLKDIFGYNYAAFILEVEGETDLPVLGEVTSDGKFTYGTESMSLCEL
ncbi:MAG: hypothetical protein MJ096_04370, partial [Clostridia bacterium]|nr:hypothetical protein [Clostridia bacterium]